MRGRYDLFSGEGAGLVVAGNLPADAAALLGARAALDGKPVRIVCRNASSTVAALHDPTTGWVLDDPDLQAAFKAL